MRDYIKGQIEELNPTYAIVEAGGVGYEINITLPTYSALVADVQKAVKLLVTEIIREDAHLLFGFREKAERELFVLLMTVSGIGANTARMIMSAYNANEIQQIIATGNSRALSAVKGVGPKTAQRVIVDLKDKVLKIDFNNSTSDLVAANIADESIKQEAVSALTMLGFSAAASGKVVDKLLNDNPTQSVEQVIKQALKML